MARVLLAGVGWCALFTLVACTSTLPEGCPPTCQDVNLIGKQLNGLDLSKALLTEARLKKAQLTGVVLTEADLTGADLSEANLRDAKLSDALLIGTNLQRANL